MDGNVRPQRLRDTYRREQLHGDRGSDAGRVHLHDPARRVRGARDVLRLAASCPMPRGSRHAGDEDGNEKKPSGVPAPGVPENARDLRRRDRDERLRNLPVEGETADATAQQHQRRSQSNCTKPECIPAVVQVRRPPRGRASSHAISTVSAPTGAEQTRKRGENIRRPTRRQHDERVRQRQDPPPVRAGADTSAARNAGGGYPPTNHPAAAANRSGVHEAPPQANHRSPS